MSENQCHYLHQLPSSRLGVRHKTLASYLSTISSSSLRNEEGHNRVEYLYKDVFLSSETVVELRPMEFAFVVVLSRNDGVPSSATCTSREGDNDAYNHSRLRNHRDTQVGDEKHSHIRILLGKKLRGFGSGLYNCIGGKLESSLHEHAHPAKGAVRELEEECGIKVSLDRMDESFVGKIHFTFEDEHVNKNMLVHLFCVFLSSLDVTKSPAGQMKGCDEIEPCWFHNIYNLPLDKMFADDSIWLTRMLDHYDSWFANNNHTTRQKSACNGLVPTLTPPTFQLDARFHFCKGGAETNSILHYYFIERNNMSCSYPTKKKEDCSTKHFTLEQRLFHALHNNNIHSPSIKEFKENWAMANAVRKYMKDGIDGSRNNRMEYVLDIAGGHGALGALFLLLVPTCHTAIVIDPAECNGGKSGVREAWSQFWGSAADEKYDGMPNRFSLFTKKKELRYRHECLRTGLRTELDCILQQTNSANVTIVACHACQHLTDETLQIASEYGVNVAVMPCCQKDHDGWWKGLASELGKNVDNDDKVNRSLSIGTLMDILAAGKMMSWDTGLSAGVRYRVKMKLIDESISRHNRIILCKAMARDNKSDCDRKSRRGGILDERIKLAHAKLTRAYQRAHRLTGKDSSENITEDPFEGRHHDSAMAGLCVRSVLVGFCIGTVLSFLMSSFIRKKLS